mmetsp:Transcript_49087/g.140544  ORF Transcript_49087/g.140544 Transcript_49087/m.140544 type:complete len:247 (+) Transcript_49087:3239-3979(+)
MITKSSKDLCVGQRTRGALRSVMDANEPASTVTLRPTHWSTRRTTNAMKQRPKGSPGMLNARNASDQTDCGDTTDKVWSNFPVKRGGTARAPDCAKKIAARCINREYSSGSQSSGNVRDERNNHADEGLEKGRYCTGKEPSRHREVAAEVRLLHKWLSTPTTRSMAENVDTRRATAVLGAMLASWWTSQKPVSLSHHRESRKRRPTSGKDRSPRRASSWNRQSMIARKEGTWSACCALTVACKTLP